MHEVKDIFERILEAPAPPMRTDAEIVGVAHRAARRRTIATMSGSGAAALMIVAVTFGLVHVTATPPTPPLAQASATATAPVTVPMPSLHAVDSHIAAVAALLIARTPSGLTHGQPETTFPWAMWLHDGEYLASQRLVMHDGRNRHGDLDVNFVIGATVETGDGLCTPAVVAEVTPVVLESGIDCETLTVADQSIQITTGARVIAATRFLDGGFVTVASRQGTLATPPLSASALAALAADPALLP